MSKEIENIKKYVRAANYLSVGQIYLQSNFLLKNKLTFDDIQGKLKDYGASQQDLDLIKTLTEQTQQN